MYFQRTSSEKKIPSGGSQAGNLSQSCSPSAEAHDDAAQR